MLAFNIHVYDTLKFVHVLAAITWIGSGIFVQFEATKLRRANDQTRLTAFAKDIAFWGTRLFMPASLIVLLMGLSLVLYSDLGFSHTWIWLGLIGYAATFVTGAFFIGPTSGKLATMSEDVAARRSIHPGGDGADLRHLAHRSGGADPGGRRHGVQAGDLALIERRPGG